MTLATIEKPAVATRMAVQVLSENLIAALAQVKHAMPGGYKALPILANVRLDTDRGRLRITATDLDIAVTRWVGAKVDAEGGTTVPLKFLQDLVKAGGKNTVALTVESDGKLAVEQARATMRIDTLPVADYPLVPEVSDVKDGTRFTVNPDALAAMVGHIEDSAARDDSRPVLTSAHLLVKSDSVKAAAADGFRLSVYTLPLYDVTLDDGRDGEFMVPVAGLRTVLKLFPVKSHEAVTFVFNQQRTRWFAYSGANPTWSNLEVCGQLTQGTFPDYGQLILPDDDSTLITFNPEDLLAQVKRASVVARDGAGIIRLSTTLMSDPDKLSALTVAAVAHEIADYRGEVDCAFTHTGTVEAHPRIALNQAYLIPVLEKMVKAKQLGSIRIKSGKKDTGSEYQCNMQGVGSPGIDVIMPMFVQW